MLGLLHLEQRSWGAGVRGKPWTFFILVWDSASVTQRGEDEKHRRLSPLSPPPPRLRHHGPGALSRDPWRWSPMLWTSAPGVELLCTQRGREEGRAVAEYLRARCSALD